MILTGSKIKSEQAKGNLQIEPFDEKQLNPNSYDFRLGNTLLVYEDGVLDAAKNNRTKTLTIPPEGLVLQPDVLYLGHTEEVIGSKVYVPILRGKSSTGRMGLFINITADLIDIGSLGQFTLMLHTVQPLRIYPGMRIGQVTFWHTSGEVNLYDGKYQGSRKPVASQSYRDFRS
jgi:dCTP deaminase